MLAPQCANWIQLMGDWQPIGAIVGCNQRRQITQFDIENSVYNVRYE